MDDWYQQRDSDGRFPPAANKKRTGWAGVDDADDEDDNEIFALGKLWDK